jgi:Grx4 family monothiol glutaredoxin
MPPEHASIEPVLRERIAGLLQANKVVLFMKGEPRAPQCGFSAKAVGALDGLGVDYAHVDVLADAEIREGIKAWGDWPTIPQLYIDGELVGGSDIIVQMANSGELNTALGLAPPDRTAPMVTITPAAFEMLHKALHDAGSGYTLQVEVDPRYNAKLQLAPVNDGAIATEVDGIRVQFDLASARRAEGMSIDWVDDARGRGLVIDNPTRRRGCANSRRSKRPASSPRTHHPGRRAPAGRTRVRGGQGAVRDARPRASRRSKRCRRTRRSRSCAITAVAARRLRTLPPTGIHRGLQRRRRHRRVGGGRSGDSALLNQVRVAQPKPPPASSHACSSGVVARPSAALRCGKRPKRLITS